MLEVLADAFLTFERTPPGRWGKHEADRFEVMRWFAAPDPDVSINLRDFCDALGLNLPAVERRARALAIALPCRTVERVCANPGSSLTR